MVVKASLNLSNSLPSTLGVKDSVSKVRHQKVESFSQS